MYIPVINNNSTSLTVYINQYANQQPITVTVEKGVKGDTGDVNPQMPILVAEAQTAANVAVAAAANAQVYALYAANVSVEVVNAIATVESLTLQTEANAAYTYGLSQQVLANSNYVYSLSQAIAANTNDVAISANNAAANAQYVYSLSQSVAANNVAVYANAQYVYSLSQQTLANANFTYSISQSVAANVSYVYGLSQAVASNNAAVYANANYVYSLSQQVYANAQYVSGLASSVSANATYVYSLSQIVEANTATVEALAAQTAFDTITVSNLAAQTALSAADANTAAQYAYANALYTFNLTQSVVANNAAVYANAQYVYGLAQSISSNTQTILANAAAFSSNASNLTSGTVNVARLPFGMNQNVLTTSSVQFDNLVLTGGLFVNGTITTVGANNFAVTDSMLYLNNGVLADITGILSANGSYVTFVANNNYSASWEVEVDDVNPSAYNGVYIISSANSTTFTIPNTVTAPFVSGGMARGRSSLNPDIGFAAGYNDGVYHHTGFFRDHTNGTWKVFDNYKPEPDESIYIDQSNSTFHLANFMANTIFIGNNSVYGTLTSFGFSGTANNATYAFGKAESNINANSATYLGGFTSSYFAANSSLANYYLASNPAGYITASANITGSANSATYLGSKSEANLNVNSAVYSTNSSFAYKANSVTYFGGLTADAYQTTSGLAANVATLTANNSNNFGGQGPTYYVSNTYLNGLGYVSNAQLASNLSNYITNTAAYSTFAQNTAIYTYAASNTYVNITFQTMAGLAANVATLTSNNTNNFGGQAPSYYVSNTYLNGLGYVSNAQLASNLSNYITNTTAYSVFAQNTAIYAYAASNTYVNSTFQTIATVNTAISSYLPNYTGALNAASYSVGGVFLANSTQLSISVPLFANSSSGTQGQVLTSNGTTGSSYWAAAPGVNTAAQYTFSNTITFTANVNANTVNAASHTIGTSFIANSTYLLTTGPIRIANAGISANAWTTNGIGLIQSAATFTDTSTPASGFIGTAYMNYFGPQTYAAANTSVTVSTLYGTYFAAPSGGTNVSTNNRYAIGTDSLLCNGYFNIITNGALCSINAGSATLTLATIGPVNIGSGTATGIISVGYSTATQAVNIATGATTSGNTKTVNIGTGGVSGSQTNIVVGSSTGNTLLTVYANSTTFSGTVNAGSYSIGSAFIANSSLTTVATPLNANGSTGTSGYMLTSNGATGSPYWAAAPGVNTSAQYTFSNTITFSGNTVFNGNTSVNTNLTVTGTIVPRHTYAGAANGTLTINASSTDVYTANGLNGTTTFGVPSGTPFNGQKLIIRIKDSGTSINLAWNITSPGFRNIGTSLPTATVANKWVYIGCVYNSIDSYWDVIALTQQA